MSMQCLYTWQPQSNVNKLRAIHTLRTHETAMLVQVQTLELPECV